MMVSARPDAYTIWSMGEVARRLKWYQSVMENQAPARFQVCRRIPISIDLKEASNETLQEEHKRRSGDAHQIFSQIEDGAKWKPEGELPDVDFLDLKIELANRMLSKCSFCEWNCQVDRTSGKIGFCRLDSSSFVTCFFHHYGEEAPLVGTKGQGGSGTIFFESCNFRCVFCQNNDISQVKNMAECTGVRVTPRALALIGDELRREGAANINYVGGEPTPNLHTILGSLKHMKENAPLLWNSNMYCSMDAMELLNDIIDIWLPDFKYGNDGCAQRLSLVGNKVSYIETVKRNHALAAQNGNMIIRHLVLPGHIKCCTKPVLSWISEKMGDRVLVNIMAQYHPDNIVLAQAERYKEICRRPSREEMDQAYGFASELGILYEPVS